MDDHKFETAISRKPKFDGHSHETEFEVGHPLKRLATQKKPAHIGESSTKFKIEI